MSQSKHVMSDVDRSNPQNFVPISHGDKWWATQMRELHYARNLEVWF